MIFYMWRLESRTKTTETFLKLGNFSVPRALSTLALTVDSNQYAQLIGWIDLRVSSSGLKIRNLGHLSACDITTLYAESGALIYPSLFESYGLPLLEATSFGLPIIASELDYVRDVSDPVFSFDPTSAVSIARSVKRYLGRKDRLAHHDAWRVLGSNPKSH
ncbi:MAG: glycosyltransferase [Betaproteobacteria bacterium]|uniref:Glycosyltransferase n=1 Tax=Candidatus Proximibacter danicus TaxID=2954365 RepID=A0A9D7K3C2_9PROT|nr:glycosyltransferase [Candidatus Proximibacter danicus]